MTDKTQKPDNGCGYIDGHWHDGELGSNHGILAELVAAWEREQQFSTGAGPDATAKEAYARARRWLERYPTGAPGDIDIPKGLTMKPEFDPERKDWSVITKTRGGHVSILPALTLDQAVKTYNSLHPERDQVEISHRIHPDYREKGGSFGGLGVSGGVGGGFAAQPDDGEIVMREVIGPQGWDGLEPDQIEYWPQMKIIWCDDKGKELPAEFQNPTIT